MRLYVRPVWDGSFVLMLLLALSTLVGGAWLSAAKERRVRGGGGGGGGVGGGYGVGGEEGEPQVAYLDLTSACCFIVLASCALVLLFFLIEWLIYALLVVFAVGGGSSLATLLGLALGHLWPAANRRLRLGPLGDVRLWSAVAVLPAAAVAVVWFVCRHATWSWLLQDALGVSLLLQLQRVLKLSSIKVASALLSLAFVYDVFWTFASTLFFSSSVMTTVATGGASGEDVPMLLRLPRMQDELHGNTMLGLGDIALPGLLVSFLLRFDFHKSLSLTRGYFALVTAGYALGLVLTYLALVWTRRGQPALLYIVPCTLYVVLAVAWCRGDLREVWEGTEQEKAEEQMHNARLNGAARSRGTTQTASGTGSRTTSADAAPEGPTAALLRRDSVTDSEDSGV